MRKVYLEGILGEKFGEEWNLAVNSPAEAMQAISAQRSGFKQFLIEGAKDGTVKEVWLAANRAFKKAEKRCGDWHCYLESVELLDGKIIAFYGS